MSAIFSVRSARAAASMAARTAALRGGLIAGSALVAGSALIAALIAAPALAASPVIDETLAPPQITIGESAELRIRSLGADVEPPALPNVAGLEFRIVERLQGVELVHGAALATSIAVVRVTPEVAGTFIIPEVSPKSPPLVLRVHPANFVEAPSTSKRTVPGETSANGIHMSADDDAFIRLSTERRDVYVGESVPIAIELGLRAGAVSSLNGLPALTGTDFTLDLSRPPDRRETVVDGAPFVILTWHSVLAPVQAGDFSLAVDVPLTIRVSTRPQREVQLEDQLGDPFMQRIFGTTVPKAVKAVSPPLVLTVHDLPPEGRPAQFSGAVGRFGISSDLSSATAAVGDPLTLRLHVEGAGNFDRVDSAMLDHVEHWKTYPPTSSFKPGNALRLEGEKIFEQPVIASTAGEQTLPALTFAYFDPAARSYQTLRTAPLRVTISPPLAGSAPTASPTAPGARALAALSSAGLRPDWRVSGASASSLVPLYLRPSFLAIPSLLTLMVGGAWFQLRRRADPGYRASLRDRNLSNAARRAIAQMEQAARAEDGVRFFNLARGAVQESLAARWQTAPEQVTAAEVAARLEGDGGREEIRQLFVLADEANYAGQGLRGSDWTRWIEVVRRRTLEDAR